MIYYLEGFDIDMNNKMLLASLLPQYKDKKFVVMVKAEWCGHCKVSTPVFENAAKEMENSSDTLYCIADITSDPAIKDKTKMFKDFRGFPHFSSFMNGVEIPNDHQNAGGKRDIDTFKKMGRL
jgi:thiol-disulfide isomerase/thioredoxin